MRDRQCALNHDATESAPMYLFFYLFIVSGVINKPTTVELCISPVYRRLAVAKLTPILIIGHPLPSSSIYNDPWHPLCSVYELDSPLRQPSASYSMHFFTQSSSFHSTCPYQRSLFCCYTNAMSSIPSLSLSAPYLGVYLLT